MKKFLALVVALLIGTCFFINTEPRPGGGPYCGS